MTAGQVSVHEVMAEVATQVRLRSAAGEPPGAVEREINQAFELFAPHGGGTVSRDGPEVALASLARASSLDAAAPLVGRRPGEGVARRVLGASTSWYVRYVVHQIGAFASAEVGALRQLDRRLRAVEMHLGVTGGPVRSARQPAVAPVPPGLTYPAPAVETSWWQPLAVDHLAGVTGRVLHAECGTGALLGALVEAGNDAYGVDPAPGLAAASGPTASPELEVWTDSASAHLGAVSDGGLGGLVLSGCVDRLPVPQLRGLAALAHAKLDSGGRLVLASATPEAWEEMLPAPAVELAGGRPLHPQSWTHLLQSAGFEVAGTKTALRSFAIAAVRR